MASNGAFQRDAQQNGYPLGGAVGVYPGIAHPVAVDDDGHRQTQLVAGDLHGHPQIVQAEGRVALWSLHSIINIHSISEDIKTMTMNTQTSSPSPAPAIKHVLAVMSGKGGVGKSTTAALLAAGLRRAGWQIGLLDADVTGASIPKLFGIRQPPLADAQGILLPAMTHSGIKLISVNLMLEHEDDAVIWRGPLISKMIQQFWNDVAWGQLDALVVDLPPGTSDAALTVLQSLPITGVIIVTTPQNLADMIVRKAANMTRQVGKPILRIIENMGYAICPHCGARPEIFGTGHAAELAATFAAPFLGRLGLDPALTRAGDAGQIEMYDSAEFATILQTLQKQLANEAA